jgi:cell division protein FtsI (penicillin-binding protein 3)
LSFGQEVGVTAMQMTMAAAAVANGGYLMKPLIVKEVENASGDVVKQFKPVVTRQVLQPQTVEVLTDILTTVVKEGTGRHAQIPGYTVAGKTGTAQKVDASGRYSMIDHVASFVGFVPARHPAFVILVSLDTPKGVRNEGGDVAAPVFARVAEHALRQRAVPSDDPARVLRVAADASTGFSPVAYRPAPPAPAASPAPDEPGVMPDLRGRPAREAALLAARKGLIVELKGSGRVADQAPPPGTEIEPGMTGVLTLGGEAEGAHP